MQGNHRNSEGFRGSSEELIIKARQERRLGIGTCRCGRLVENEDSSERDS